MWQLWAAVLLVVSSVGCATEASGSKARDAGSNHAGGGASATPAGSGAGKTAGAGHAAPAGHAGAPALPTLGPITEPGDPGSVEVTLEVHADLDQRVISPLVYGSNGTPEFAKNRFTVARSGGNRLTAYNWENNASNAGSDYMFQNDGYLSASNEPGKPIVDGVKEAATRAAAAIVTIPIVDYVSADKSPGGDVRNSGKDYLSTRFKQNKAAKDGAFASTPDTADAFVYQDEFVAYLKSHAPADAQVLFSLDNEPDLWSSTHAEVHPKPVTYAELWERTQRFSTAIKQAWQGAEVLGPVSYGWNGYVNLQNASDAKGDFLEWYLDQAKAAEASGAGRLVDYLDLHWYPEARGGNTRITEASTDAAVVSARVQAPRSLWDKSYNEQSWVHDNVSGPIDLLHRLKTKIDAHYPGTKLAFTEWNYGGGGHISGAIASADVLGIFGREGVGLATYWGLGDNESFAYAAFRAYRNYDGAGATFGDISVRATTTDVSNVTVYASLDATSVDQVVIVAINKAMSPKQVGLKLSHPTSYTSAAIYELSGTKSELSAQPAQSAAAHNAWRWMLPALSVNVIVPKN